MVSSFVNTPWNSKIPLFKRWTSMESFIGSTSQYSFTPAFSYSRNLIQRSILTDEGENFYDHVRRPITAFIIKLFLVANNRQIRLNNIIYIFILLVFTHQTYIERCKKTSHFFSLRKMEKAVDNSLRTC